MTAAQDHIQRHGRKWVGAGVGLCAAFLVQREGFEPVAKHERIDPPAVITWCMGRTNFDDPTVKIGTRFTKADCTKQLMDDLVSRYGPPIQACIPQFVTYGSYRQAALVSAGYNLGPGRICKGAVGQNLRNGEIKAGCFALLEYDGIIRTRADGTKYKEVVRGLKVRRQAEYQMCLRED